MNIYNIIIIIWIPTNRYSNNICSTFVRGNEVERFPLCSLFYGLVSILGCEHIHRYINSLSKTCINWIRQKQCLSLFFIVYTAPFFTIRRSMENIFCCVGVKMNWLGQKGMHNGLFGQNKCYSSKKCMGYFRFLFLFFFRCHPFYFIYFAANLFKMYAYGMVRL